MTFSVNFLHTSLHKKPVYKYPTFYFANRIRGARNSGQATLQRAVTVLEPDIVTSFYTTTTAQSP